MDVMREKRRVAKLLRSVAVSCSQSTVCDGCVDPLHHPPPACSGVKSLGSADIDEESAASWVVRMKSLQEEKKKAEKKVLVSLSLSLFLLISCKMRHRTT